MTRDLDFANRSLDNINLADKDARDEHRVTIGVTPPFKDFPFSSGELLGNVFAGLSNITGATDFRNSLYGVDAGFTPARLVRIDTRDPINDNGPFGSLGDLPDGIDDPQALVRVREMLYVVNGNATNAGLWRVNPDNPDDTSGDFGRVGGFPAGLTNPRGAFPANNDIYIVQGNPNPDFDELWRINEFNPTSLANPLGLQYSLPANITGAPTSGVFHDAYAYVVTGQGRQLFRVDPDNLSHGQPTTPENRFGLVGELPIPNTETVTAVASLGGILYVFTESQLWAKSVGNVELTRFKADVDSPAFTGTPTAPTPADDDDSTRIATTEFVVDRISAQPAEGSTLVGDHSQVILWLYSGQVPPDPPDAYNSTTEEFLADTGNWWTSEASALAARINATDALWVAYGGTDVDTNGLIHNRTWTVHASTQIRYSPDRNTTTTSEENDSRYISFRLPSGDWSPWIAISNDNDGWVNVWSDVDAYTTGADLAFINVELDSAFDSEYYNEIRFRLRAFGTRNTDGDPIWIGVQGDYSVTRKESAWTGIISTADTTLLHGSYKLRLDDITGLDVVQIGSSRIDPDLDSNIHNTIDDYPERRQSFTANLVAESATDFHALRTLRMGNWPSRWAKCIMDIDFR